MELNNTFTGTQHFYVVIGPDEKFFAKYNVEENRSEWVDNPLNAKMFSNKYEVKLRPQERLVEVEVKLSSSNTNLSEPFRLKKRTKPE